MPSNFCRMPYEAVAVTSVGKISPCCAFDNSKANNLQTVSEYWKSDLKKEVIEHFDANKWHPGCRSCWEQENNGLRSKRQKYNSNNSTLPFKKDIAEPVFVEVALGNQCNVACVTCGSDFSTGWRQYDRNMPELFSDRLEYLKVNFKIDRAFIENLLESMKNNPQLKIELIGGEPFFNKEGLFLLNEMAKNKMPNEVALTSNCTLINDNTIDMIKNLNIHINPSIDAVGSMYEYIRNYDFNIIEQNVQRLIDANVHLILMPVFSVFNVWHIPELLRWMLKLDLKSRDKVKLNNFVHGPDYCAINNIPHELLKDTIQEIKELDTTSLVSAEEKESFLDHLINYKQVDKESTLKRTLEWINKCNEIRGTRIQSLDDDLDLYTEYLNHAI